MPVPGTRLLIKPLRGPILVRFDLFSVVLLCCICCCLPAPQADLTRFQRVIVRWVSTAKRKTSLHTDFRSACRSKRINPLKITLPTQFLRRIEEEMLRLHANSLDPSTTPSLCYIYFEIASLATSNIASSNVNGILSRFAQYYGRLLFTWPGVPSNDLSTRKPNCFSGTLVLYLSNPPRGMLTNRCWVPLVRWIIVAQSTVRTARVSHSRWTRLYSKSRAKQSRNKCIVAKALWTELCSERIGMEPQHLFFDSTEEMSRQGYFQWI